MKFVKSILVFVLVGLCLGATKVKAADHADFSVRVEKSTYQVDTTISYFDLAVPTNKNVDLIVHVTNNASHEITIKGQLAQATTNVNGVVEYGPTKNKLTKNIPFALSDVAKFEASTKKIAAKQMADFIVHLNIPTNDYAGVVAGGLTFSDVSEQTKKHSGVFENRFAYAVGLVLHGNQAAQKNDLALKKVTATQFNSRNVISAKINNLTSNYVNQVKLTAKLLDANQKEVLSETKENLQLAPDSVFNYPLYYNQQDVKSGTYTLDLTLESKGYVWHFTRDVKITLKKAIVLNKTDVTKKPSNNLNLIYILIGIVVVLLLIIIFLVFKRRKDEQ